MQDCIFCKIIEGKIPSHKVDENDFALAFLDINPVSKYHTLVISKKHFDNIFDVEENYLNGMITLTKKITRNYENKLGIKNLQLINSSGKEAQQDIFHIHFHIVPRNKEDGQDIKWKTYPEMSKEFPKMIKKIK